MDYFVLKFLHVIGASVLLGTGAGIAFFITTAVVLQPVTGALLAQSVGYSLFESWVLWSIVLYLITGAFWLPVVLMQMRMRDLAHAAVAAGKELPRAYHVLFAWWFAFGFPAFAAVLVI